MPSKPKKSSKTPQSSDRYSSPRALPASNFETRDDDDGRLVRVLEEAAGQYPSLIGKSALIGRVADVERGSKGSTVWLSESSMVAASLAHGSLVSVSFPSVNSKFSGSFSLSSFSDELAGHIGINLLDRLTNEAGNYFALAKVCCSSKIEKNGVRLSSSLSNTMGDPSLGRVVFIHPVQSQIAPKIPTKEENLCNFNPLLVCDCSELYLELVHARRSTTENTSLKISSEISYGSRNGVSGSSSPKTPMNQIKASSSVTNQLTSPICEDSTKDVTNLNGVSTVPFDITELLGDEGAAKRLLNTWATPWLYSRCLLRGNLVTIPILSQICSFQVVGAEKLLANGVNCQLTNGNRNYPLAEASESLEDLIDAFVVQRETKVCLGLPSKPASKTPEGQSSSNLDFGCKADSEDNHSKLGGLSKEYGILKDIIVSSSANTLSSLGLRTTKGVLLHGPPGTGKTSLARLCVHDAGVNLFSVNGPELVSQYYGESERALHEVFESAHHAAPAVIFVDELDAIAPARKDGGEELSQRMVATLLNLMDGIGRTEGILVIAATNRPDSIEPALRRPGRLDREIEIGVPSPKQRLEILHSLLSDMEHSLLDIQVENLAISTHGFVGADLAALCNEAALVCLRRYANSRNSSTYLYGSQIPFNDSDAVMGSDCLKDRGENLRDYLDSATSSVSKGNILDENINGLHDGMTEEFMLKVTFEDFEKAKMKVRPSAMREVILEVPKVHWEDVGGQREVKNQLMEAVEWPQKHQEAFKRIGTRPPTGVLMFGPPGCSKTLMARAVASEAGLNFLAVKGPELFSKWVGESEKAVRSLFAKARANAPSIIFFDEIDGLASVRGKENEGVSVSDRVMSQLLVELDGLHQRLNVTVIAATNRPDKIDSALLRPGRFDRLLYVGPPNESDREEIFHIHLRKIPCSSDVSIKVLSALTEGFTGADISSVCREAALKAMEENVHASEITMQHLNAIIEKMQPTSTQLYQELSDKFQRLVNSS